VGWAKPRCSFFYPTGLLGRGHGSSFLIVTGGGSLRSWGKRRSELGKDLPFLIEKSGNFDFNSKKLKGDDQQEWDFVFMDCPPTIDDLAILRLKKSDFLIVPLLTRRLPPPWHRRGVPTT